MRAVGDAFSRSPRRERGEWISQSGFVKITMVWAGRQEMWGYVFAAECTLHHMNRRAIATSPLVGVAEMVRLALVLAGISRHNTIIGPRQKPTNRHQRPCLLLNSPPRTAQVR